VPGWFPLVAERAHGLLSPEQGDAVVEVLGSRMRLDLREYTQRRFYYHCYEAEEARFLDRWLRPGDTMVDVGAHVGLFVLYGARQVGPSGVVHAFEPVPYNYERLVANVALNGYDNVRLNRAAVGDRAGEVSLGLYEQSSVGTGTGGYSVDGQYGSSITAPLVKLDDYLADSVEGRVRLLKIDVEGLEPQVLDGLAETLRASPPDAIMFELFARMLEKHGSRPGELYELLEDAGYRLYELDRRGRTVDPPSPAEIEEATRAWDFDRQPRSRLRVGLGMRKMLFNAVAVHEG
jgi:FkbM family methyltransferase